MKKVLFFSLLLVTCMKLKAQDGTVKDLKKDADKSIKKDPNDTIPQIWKLGGSFTLQKSCVTLT